MHLVLTVCLALVSFTQVQARLTEKEPDLIKRFGPVVSRGDSRTSFEGRSFTVGKILSFRSDQWTIDTLMIDDRCSRITYRKVGNWTDEQIIGLLDRNGGYGTYKEERTGLGKSFRKWKQADGTLAQFSANDLTLTHPTYERRLALLKAKAQAESKQAPKF